MKLETSESHAVVILETNFEDSHITPLDHRLMAK